MPYLVKCGMKLLIHSQTPMVAPLQFLESISNFISPFLMDVIAQTYLNWSKNIVKAAPVIFNPMDYEHVWGANETYIMRTHMITTMPKRYTTCLITYLFSMSLPLAIWYSTFLSANFSKPVSPDTIWLVHERWIVRCARLLYLIQVHLLGLRIIIGIWACFNSSVPTDPSVHHHKATINRDNGVSSAQHQVIISTNTGL